MNPLGLPKRWFRRGRKAGVSLCAAWFMLTVLGVPMPAPQVSADPGAQPYICQGHGCGCPSAESCWKQCCCYTNEEKLAWAMQQGISPPPEIVAEVLAARQAKDKAQKVAKSCCGSKSCCEKSADSCPQPAVATTTAGDTPFSFIQHMRCRGLQPGWYTLGGAIEPPAIVSATTETAVTPHLMLPILAWESFSTPPPVPPPRCA